VNFFHKSLFSFLRIFNFFANSAIFQWPVKISILNLIRIFTEIKHFKLIIQPLDLNFSCWLGSLVIHYPNWFVQIFRVGWIIFTAFSIDYLYILTVCFLIEIYLALLKFFLLRWSLFFFYNWWNFEILNITLTFINFILINF